MYAFDNSYYFRPYRGKSNYWLNRYGEGTISDHQKATLYAATGAADQRLKVKKVTGGCQLLSDLNNAYGLNIYGRGAGSVCDFFPVSGNESDALIDLLTVDATNNLYRIKMITHDLYLTPEKDASGAKLTWETASGADNQVWQLCTSQSSGGSSGGGSGSTKFVHRIEMPYNYDQKKGPSSGFRNAGCACTCGMDIASFYSNKQYTFAEFRSYYDDYSNNTDGGYVYYHWKTPEFTMVADETVKNKAEAATIAYIKRYIARDTPVACHCLPVTKSEHWVVPYAYENKAGWGSIRVLDPYQGTTRTMAEAMDLSCGGTSGGVDRIMCHPSHLIPTS